MKNSLKTIRKGFTLLEMTVVMLVSIGVAAIIMAMLNQQIAFLNIFRAQSFLNEEAPIISHHVSKLLSTADGFRMHETLDDARANELNGVNPRLTSSPVLVLNFRQPQGGFRRGVLSFEDRGEGDSLYYYVEAQEGVLNEPEWTVTREAANVEFFMDAGIVVTRLTGPAGEEISFTGAME